jgi:cell division protein FtsI (penicillin-binding protein 3)
MKASRRSTGAPRFGFSSRLLFFYGFLVLCGALLLWRAVQLQLVDREFLAAEGEQRSIRVVTMAAHRGEIRDRNGEALAVSTPVDSVVVDPRKMVAHSDSWDTIARMIGRPAAEVRDRLSRNQDRSFLYLARHIKPGNAQAVRALDLEGLRLVREYRRYYPAGEVAGHVLGFTNIDDNGGSGLELGYDHWLGGQDGVKRVLQDNRGRVVQDVESLRPTEQGRDLELSIDLRIQYLAYRELLAAVRANNAKGGSMVVIDVNTGEVLAMVNQPTFNPNDRGQFEPAMYRNRAVTDLIEPGSSIKPFIIAAALESGRYDVNSRIDASKGYIRVGNTVLEDEHPIGVATLTTVLAKSSNVAMAEIAMHLDQAQMWNTLRHLGFGQMTASGFPGESAGMLSHYSKWRPVTVSSLSRGYAMQVTPLQLAQAYATIGAGGVARPVSLLRTPGAVAGRRALSARSAQDLLTMLEAVTQEGGTGTKADIPGYRVAGKTGTAQKNAGGSYLEDSHVGVFAGVAPASAPRLAAVVVIDDPGGGQYYGGDVAAPVFSAVVGGALRLLGVPPDQRAPVPPVAMPPAVVRR